MRPPDAPHVSRDARHAYESVPDGGSERVYDGLVLPETRDTLVARSGRAAAGDLRPTTAFVRLPPPSAGPREEVFAHVHGALLDAARAGFDLGVLQKTVVSLDQRARANADLNTAAILEQFLRYCFLADVKAACVLSPDLPVECREAIHRFSTHATWIAVLRGPLYPADLEAHWRSPDAPATRLPKPLQQADRIGCRLGPQGDRFFSAIPADAVSSTGGVAKWLTEVGELAFSWPDRTPDSSGLVAAGGFIEDPLGDDSAGAQTRRVGILYRGIDDAALDLVADLRGLTRGHAEPELAAHQLEDRYRTRLKEGSRAADLLVSAVSQLAEGIPLDPLTANPVLLPEAVRTPEELDYRALTELKLALQDARRTAQAQVAPEAITDALDYCWLEAESAATALAEHVRASERRLEHRLGAAQASSTKPAEHCIFYATLTGHDPEERAEVARGVRRQASMLTVLNTLASRSPNPVRIELRYRLYTHRVQGGDLEAVFEIEATALDCTPATAEMLRETFGELVHTAFLGVYGLSFGFTAPPAEAARERLLNPEHRARILRTQRGGEYLPFTGYPDWGYVLDYLRSLERPVALEMCATAGGYRGDRGGSELAPDRNPRPQTSADDFPEFSGIISELRAVPDLIQVTIGVGSDEPLSAPLLDFVGGQIGGSAGFETVDEPASNELADRERLGLAETVGFFHPPLGDFFAGSSSPRKSVLPTPVGSFPIAGIPLGTARKVHAKADRDISVTIPEADLLRHVHIIGRTGSGKTNLLRGMVSHVLESPSAGLAVIDPHGDLSSHVINSVPRARIDDVRVIDLSDPQYVPVLNPLLLPEAGGLERSRAVQDILELLRMRVFHQFTGPRFDETVRLVLDTMLDPGYQFTPSLVDVPLLLTDKDRRAEVRRRLTESELQARWRFNDGLAQTRDHLEMVDWVVSKLDDIARDETLRAVLGGSTNTVDLDSVVRSNGLLVVALPEANVGRQTAEFIGSLVLQRLRGALLRRPTGGASGAPFYLFVDEFQRFAPSGFEDLVAEARKYGVGLVLAHQNLEQVAGFSPHTGSRVEGLLQSVLGNVGSTIAFGVGASDIATVARQLSVSETTVASVPKHHALARVSVNDETLPTFTLHTQLHESRLDPRRQDDIKAHLVEHGRVAGRPEVLEEVERRRQLLGRTADEGAAPPQPETLAESPRPPADESFLDRWIRERREAISTSGRRAPAKSPSEGKGEKELPLDLTSVAARPGTADPLGTTTLQNWRANEGLGRPPRGWGDLVGPVVHLDRVAERLGEPPEVLRGRASRGHLLVLKTREATEIVPASHLQGDGFVPGLEDVLRGALQGPRHPWTVAGWLATPQDELGGRSPIAWLRSGDPPEVVSILAARFGEPR